MVMVTPLRCLLFLVQHLAKIPVLLGLRVFLGRLIQEVLVHVAERIDVLAAHASNVAGSLHAAHADAAEIHLVAGHSWPEPATTCRGTMEKAANAAAVPIN